MKKVITFVAVAIAAISGGTSFAQANSTGNIIIDPYYGYPNFGKAFYQSIEDADDTQDFKATGVGPMGLRAEYMIADRIGVGVDVIYNSNNISYTSLDSVYNSATGAWTEERKEYERKMNRVRVQARFNYHFEVSNPDLDAYFGIGAGTNNRFRKYYENGVEIDDNYDGTGSLTLIPVSFRLCTGMRYYFSENIGMNAEIGLGGPLISAGLSIRL
jgi:hypothetical protein